MLLRSIEMECSLLQGEMRAAKELSSALDRVLVAEPNDGKPATGDPAPSRLAERRADPRPAPPRLEAQQSSLSRSFDKLGASFDKLGAMATKSRSRSSSWSTADLADAKGSIPRDADPAVIKARIRRMEEEVVRLRAKLPDYVQKLILGYELRTFYFEVSSSSMKQHTSHPLLTPSPHDLCLPRYDTDS